MEAQTKLEVLAALPEAPMSVPFEWLPLRAWLDEVVAACRQHDISYWEWSAYRSRSRVELGGAR